MVYRLMVGLAAAGVETVMMMPAGSGLTESLLRTLRSHPELDRPRLEVLELRLQGTAADTEAAVAAMRDAGVSALAVLGGDGTSRVVARGCGDTPVCPLSTGTNNAFPAIREATVAGIATGLVATGQVKRETVVRRAKCLRITEPGAGGGPEDLALVDVALTVEPFLGARALWRPGDISEVVVAFGEVGAVGLSSVAGLLDPVGRSDPWGLHLRLAPPPDADVVISVPLAPGLVVPVGIAAATRIAIGEIVSIEAATGCIALDGEREIEVTSPGPVEITLGFDGPAVIDVDAVMAEAARCGMLQIPVARTD